MRSDDAKPLHLALLLSDYQQQNSGQTYNQKPEIIAGHRHDMAGKTAPNNPHQASQQWRTGTRDNPARGGAKPGKLQPPCLRQGPALPGIIGGAYSFLRFTPWGELAFQADAARFDSERSLQIVAAGPSTLIGSVHKDRAAHLSPPLPSSCHPARQGAAQVQVAKPAPASGVVTPAAQYEPRRNPLSPDQLRAGLGTYTRITMATLTLRLSVRVAWWFPIYKFCLLAGTRLTRREPDMAKVARWCERAIKVSVI